MLRSSVLVRSAGVSADVGDIRDHLTSGRLPRSIRTVAKGLAPPIGPDQSHGIGGRSSDAPGEGGVGLLLFDRADRCVFANDEAGRCLGVSAEELRAFLSAAKTVFQAGNIEVTDADGRRQSLNVCVDHCGDRTGLTAVTLRRTASQVPQEDRDRTLALIGHELRNPLSSAERLLAGVRDYASQNGIPEEAAGLCEAAAAEIGHASAILEGLLDLGRVRRDEAVEAVPVTELIERAIGQVRSRANAQNTELAVDIEAASERVEVPKTRALQAVANVLGNAVKFSPGGAVRVRVRRVGGRLVFAVRDTGRGMTSEELARATERFFTSGGGGEGLGLGLSLVKTFVESSGGRLRIASRQRLGTLVRFDLPAAAPPTQHVASATGVALVVEDNAGMRLLATHTLKHLGWSVRVAESVAAAVSELSAGDVELLLCDLHLPDGSGLDVLGRSRTRPPLCLAMTASDEPGLRQECRLGGFAGLLTKPLDASAVADALAAAGRHGPA